MCDKAEAELICLQMLAWDFSLKLLCAFGNFRSWAKESFWKSNTCVKVSAACVCILARPLVTMTQFPRSDVGSRAKWPEMTHNPLMMSLSLKDSSLKANQCGGSRRRSWAGEPAVSDRRRKMFVWKMSRLNDPPTPENEVQGRGWCSCTHDDRERWTRGLHRRADRNSRYGAYLPTPARRKQMHSFKDSIKKRKEIKRSGDVARRDRLSAALLQRRP